MRAQSDAATAAAAAGRKSGAAGPPEVLEDSPRIMRQVLCRLEVHSQVLRCQIQVLHLSKAWHRVSLAATLSVLCSQWYKLARKASFLT